MGAIIPIIFVFQSGNIIIQNLFWRCALSSLLRSFSIAYFLAVLIQSKWLKWLKWPIMLTACIIGVLLSFSYLRYNLPISPTLFAIISNTSAPEIRSFLSTLPFWIFLAMPLIITGCISIFYLTDKKSHVISTIMVRHHWLFAVCTFSVMAIVAGGGWKFKEVFQAWQFSDYKELNNWNYNRFFSWTMPRDVYSALGLACSEINLKSEYIDLQRIIDTKIIARDMLSPNDSLDVILVIGESYQPWHASLYGYPLLTTPRMSEEHQKDNLIVFRDAASVSNCTPEVIFNILTLNRVSEDEPYEKHTFFPQLFANAGWQTFYCEHQYSSTLFDMTIHDFINNQISRNMGWTKYIPSHVSPFDAENLRYDWNHIDSVKRNLPHRLTIYHIKGQHFDYEDRYPLNSAFNKFNATDYDWRSESWLDIKRKNTIAHYDNATFYNDYCLGLLFDRYRNSNAILVYTSDHGEEIYDYRDFAHREFYYCSKDLDKWIDYEIRVPLVVWMSDQFKKMYPEKVIAINKATNNVISIDDIGHFILSISRIHTSAYNPHHDFSSPLYIAPIRKTLDNVPIPPLKEVTVK